MKKSALLIALLSLCAAAGAQSFDELYSATEPWKNITSLMQNGPVRPVWKDSETFLYSTNEGGEDKAYEVSTTALTRTEVSRDSLEAAMRRSGRHFYEDPSDESYFTMGRAVKEISPDGKWVAFVRDGNVWVAENKAEEPSQHRRPGPGGPGGPGRHGIDLPEGGTQLSFDGNEADRYVQVMWSPDSKKIAALRKQELKERQILLRESRPKDQVQPKYRWLDYAKPGDTLPQETPALFSVEQMKQIPFNTSVYTNQYFLELGQWSPNSDWFTFEYNQRGHQLYQLVAVDAESGQTRTIAEEKSSTFIYYYDLYRHYFADGRRVLWISERDNWRHLYMVDALDGSIRQLTRGEWNVREILSVDEENGIVLMNANGLKAAKGEDPYNKHLLRLDLNSGSWTDLTPENANHQVNLNSDATCFVDNYSRPDLPPTSVLRSAADGAVLMTIQKADISGMQQQGFTMPEVFKAKGRDGKTDIWGTIYRPSKIDPKKKYPVVEYIYAGPHDSHVDKDFMPYTPRFMRLCELGFIVVCIDGMGTDNRSKDFQDVAWRNIKDAGFPDRILWMQAAAKKYKYMDISNVGIYGYSAGGQNTLSALLFHPEFYKVGVALCGCHDNRMDKIWWNEQWMGWPVGPWYSESSNVDNAWRLEGSLFIINGEMDDNVDPATSLQVVSELVKNGKDFRQLYLPGHTHSLGSDWITRQVFKYFWENCR